MVVLDASDDNTPSWMFHSSHDILQNYPCDVDGILLEEDVHTSAAVAVAAVADAVAVA